MFQGWDNFFFMLGSAAGGLIGLLFVVVTLTSGFERERALRGAQLFMTPTALHFACVLTASAIALAPPISLHATAALVGAVGLVGLVHALRAAIGIPGFGGGATGIHWSDVWMYGVAPAALYSGLCAAALALGLRAPLAAHALAASLLALLLLGIRNAWDLITWIAPKASGGGA